MPVQLVPNLCKCLLITLRMRVAARRTMQHLLTHVNRSPQCIAYTLRIRCVYYRRAQHERISHTRRARCTNSCTAQREWAVARPDATSGCLAAARRVARAGHPIGGAVCVCARACVAPPWSCGVCPPPVARAHLHGLRGSAGGLASSCCACVRGAYEPDQTTPQLGYVVCGAATHATPSCGVCGARRRTVGRGDCEKHRARHTSN